MRWAVALLVLALQLTLRAEAANEPEQQTITPIIPQVEQRIEPVTQPGEQRVEALTPEGVQAITGGKKNAARRGAEAVGKVVLGIVAAGVAIGVMVGSMLLL